MSNILINKDSVVLPVHNQQYTHMKIKKLLLKITNLLPILFIGIMYGQSVKIENLDKIEIRENSTINVQFNVTVGSGHDGHVSIFTTSFDGAPPTFVEQGTFVFGANNGGFDSSQSFNIRLNANSFEATGGKLYAEFERNSGIKRRSNSISIEVKNKSVTTPVVSRPTPAPSDSSRINVSFGGNKVSSIGNITSIYKGEEAPRLIATSITITSSTAFKPIIKGYKWFSKTDNDTRSKLVGTKKDYRPGKLTETTTFYRVPSIRVVDANNNNIIFNFAGKSLIHKFTIKVDPSKVIGDPILNSPISYGFGGSNALGASGINQTLREGMESRTIIGLNPTISVKDEVVRGSINYTHQWYRIEDKINNLRNIYSDVTNAQNLDLELIPFAQSKSYKPQSESTSYYYFRETYVCFTRKVRRSSGVVVNVPTCIKTWSNPARVLFLDFPEIILSPTVIPTNNPKFEIKTNFRNFSRNVVVMVGLNEVFRGRIRTGERITEINYNKKLIPDYFGRFPSQYKIFVDDILIDTGKVIITN